MEESILIILISQQKQSFISAEYHLWLKNSSQTGEQEDIKTSL